jgi:hypothetical protein
MKIFKRNKYGYKDCQYQHYQFLIIKGKTLLHLMYGDEGPCLNNRISILTSFLAPDHLFGMSVEFKGYSWSFYLFSNYEEISPVEEAYKIVLGGLR